MTMALQLFTDLVTLLWQHPLLSGLVLVLFTPPFFPILKFFSPLLISTALVLLALFTMGGCQSNTSSSTDSMEDNWEFRRAADVKVWEDKSVTTAQRVRKPDGSWIDWLQSLAESGYAWMETKLQNENWKGRSVLNDDNVSILQEATWAPTPKERDLGSSGNVTQTATWSEIDNQLPAATSPTMLFKVDSKIKAEFVANAKKTVDVKDLGEDVPASEDAVIIPAKTQSLEHASSVHHSSLDALEISKNTIAGVDSPSVDLDDSPDPERSKGFLFSSLRRNSVNKSSGLSLTSEPASESDYDATPVVKKTVRVSKSGKLEQIETLTDLIEEKGQHHVENPDGHEEVPRVLKPTTIDRVEAVKEKLEVFTHSPGQEKAVLQVSSKPPGSPLFKQGGNKVAATTSKNVVLKRSSSYGAFSDDGDSSSSGEEELSDSDSDSEFEIFPHVDPAKMKLHPPVKLNIQQLEKKLGTSLSQQGTRAHRGEVAEVQ